MKPVFFITMLALTIWACSPAKEATKTSAILTPTSRDSTAYDIIIEDIHFDRWYLLNYNEAKDRSNDYYRSKNQVAVSNWNDYYHTGRYSLAIDSYINYQPQIDYGIEVNRKLYWYFKFVLDQYGIRLFW